jgi:hypothetical protein
VRLLVCGDRDWVDGDLLGRTLDFFGYQFAWDFVLVHGGARGADLMAGQWAASRRVKVDCFPAEWDRHGKAAGPIRNQRMLDSGIDLVVAFHDDIRNSKGTKHMVGIARKAGVPVKLIQTSTNPQEVR